MESMAASPLANAIPVAPFSSCAINCSKVARVGLPVRANRNPCLHRVLLYKSGGLVNGNRKWLLFADLPGYCESVVWLCSLLSGLSTPSPLKGKLAWR